MKIEEFKKKDKKWQNDYYEVIKRRNLVRTNIYTDEDMKDREKQIWFSVFLLDIIIIIIFVSGYMILGFMGKPYQLCDNKSADFIIKFQGQNYTCGEILAINSTINYIPNNSVLATLS